MSATAAEIEAKIKQIEAKLWQKAWGRYHNKGLHNGERFSEYYYDDNMVVIVFLDVDVYETEEIARRNRCTFGKQGKYGFLGGKYCRAEARSR